MNGREDGGLRDFTRRDVRIGKRKKKEKRGRTGRDAGKEMPRRERKRRNEEIFALSRACHAVLREKNLSFSLFSPSRHPRSLFVSLSLFLEERLHSSQ